MHFIRSSVAAVIVLQDLTHGFINPCVMDLKMGTSQSTRSQSAAKKKWRSAKVNATTSAKLGVRLGGIRVRIHSRLSIESAIELVRSVKDQYRFVG